MRLWEGVEKRRGQSPSRLYEDLLCATAKIRQAIADDVYSPGSRLGGRQAINRRVGSDVGRKKVDKHFRIEVTDNDIRRSRRQEKIDAEAQLDGNYVIRTSLETSSRGVGEALDAYKSLSQVERAFRSPKTTQLSLRPVYVYSEDHVRGHVFLFLLAYYLERTWATRRDGAEPH